MDIKEFDARVADIMGVEDKVIATKIVKVVTTGEVIVEMAIVANEEQIGRIKLLMELC